MGVMGGERGEERGGNELMFFSLPGFFGSRGLFKMTLEKLFSKNVFK